ncbi:MAG: methionyl-tRNA formyltransferase, partial [bacterium]
PSELLALPPLGCINVHPSLLPQYRGASPIQAAIAAGERETGVTIMYQTDELDAGDIILQRRVPIAPDDTAATLEHTLAQVGAEALVEALRLIAAGDAARSPQDGARASYVKKLTKEHGRIDWARPADELERLIRAMNPWPSAFTSHHGKLLKIWNARTTSDHGAPGVIHDMRRGEGFVVGTGSGSLIVLEVQPEGGRRMTADEYVRGYRLNMGERLGEKIDGSAEARKRGSAI